MNLAFCSSVGDSDTERERLYRNALRQVWPSVVKIDAHGAGGSRRGSGFIYRTYGRVLTAGHTVRDAQAVEVTLDNGCRYGARVVADAREVDVAVLEIAAYNNKFARFGDSEAVQVGQPVVVISALNDESFQRIIFDGEVRALVLPGGASPCPDAKRIWIDVPLVPGCSGSPLVDSCGEVVGIISSKDSAGHGVAIPIEQVKHVLKAMLDESPTPPKMVKASIRQYPPERSGGRDPRDAAAHSNPDAGGSNREVSDFCLGAECYVQVEDLAREDDN